MPNNEHDILIKLQMPHLSYGKVSAVSKRSIAYNVLARGNEELLLITPMGFNVSSVFAGLSEKHIVYIATGAPLEYKKEILDLLDNSAEIKDIIEIAKTMDDDLDGNSTKHQERVKNTIQYVKDNRLVFEF